MIIIISSKNDKTVWKKIEMRFACVRVTRRDVVDVKRYYVCLMERDNNEWRKWH